MTVDKVLCLACMQLTDTTRATLVQNSTALVWQFTCKNCHANLVIQIGDNFYTVLRPLVIVANRQ